MKQMNLNVKSFGDRKWELGVCPLSILRSVWDVARVLNAINMAK